jgi:hypothetical protein
MALNGSKRTFESFAEANGPESSSAGASSKKPRADDAALLNAILKLPIERIQPILYAICHEDPKYAAVVQSSYKTFLAKEASKPPVNFDHYSKECWYTLNKKYARLSCSAQCDMAGEIESILVDAKNSILEEAGPDTRFETRRNALDVLRKICKSVMLCDERQIRHELMKDGVLLGEFANAMLKFAKGMTEEERERYKEEGLYEKLVDLQTECESIDMEGLAEVYAVFDGDAEDDEGDESDDSTER